MVARITTPHRINDALNYNEQKVKKGIAECIYAGNYLLEGKDMNFYQKLTGFETRNELNDRATTKTLHVSLNFDPSENLSHEKLIQIATLYMHKIGFGDQPYLIYKHGDAGHPHIHIVATTIKEDGKRINTHNLGRNQSEKARKEIETLYNLVKAERQTKKLSKPIPPVELKKVIYGKDETKRSISNVVNTVVSKYKFTSLPEFNAVLQQFNVYADRGKEDGRIFKNGGMIYRVLDEKGNKIGVPVKASSISTKPTLKKLQELFSKNELRRDPDKQSLKEKIDSYLSKRPGTMQEMITLLAKEQINVVLRKSKDGRIYGITFVDNKSHCVFNGSDLGKSYSATALQQNFLSPAVSSQESRTDTEKNKGQKTSPAKAKLEVKEMTIENTEIKQSTTELLMNAQQIFNPASQLSKKKRKKKRKNLGL